MFYELVFIRLAVHIVISVVRITLDAYSMDQSKENGVDNPDGVDSLGDVVTPSPEYLQRKLYFLLEHMKKMHGALPE